MARKDEEETGGPLNGPPNKKYEQFFNKFPEIETLKTADWKPVHLLAYFCKKYETQYNTKYKFKFNSPSPVNCFEVFQIKKLASMMSANPQILREYIDWVYKTRVVEAKRKLTSISFLTVEGLVNEYKTKFLFADKKDLHVNRSTQLPQEYVGVFKEINVNVQTYGDLAFIYQMPDKSLELEKAFSKIVEMGFDLEVLGRVI